ncbi:MAG TPA: response regulator, partial [Bryobacteraceae bacterium]|nr:response regulator [Bryobacteraceae bacterium]
SPDYAALVQQWLSVRTEAAFVLNWTDSLQAGLNRLKQGGVDVILLDLGLPDSNGLETFTRAKLQALGVPMILLSGDNHEQLALQMVQEGAQDYIVKGSCNGNLLAKAIQYAIVRTAGRGEQAPAGPNLGQATVIGVMGVKGGVGGTTIACNLAAELRRQTEKKTLLADLDLNSGTVSFLMGAESEYSVLDAIHNVDRLDQSFWEGLISPCSSGVDVLRSPSIPGAAEPNADHLHLVLAMARKSYGWVVVDLGRPSGFSLPLLDKVNELFLVTTTGIAALYEAKRSIDALRKMGFEGERLRVIVNQLTRTEEFSGNALGQLFGIPVYARFSAAAQELHDSCVQKRLPAVHSEFRVQMAGLARKMAGLQIEKPRSRVSQMFSFAEKSPAVEMHASKAGRP